MKNHCAILAIDEGTSGTRSAIVGADGSVSCLEYAALDVDTPQPGTVEQDANQILQKTLCVCNATIARAGPREIVALALSTQRATAVLWDTQTGQALVPAMVWQDTRYAGELAELAPQWDQGLMESVGRPVGVRSLYLWAARHIRHTPVVARAFEQKHLAFGTIDSWLLWHLSDLRLCVTTPTNVTSTGAYVLNEHRYHYDWIDALGFPRELLPLLRQDVDDFGRTRKELLGIEVPILASAGDQHAGAVGLGCVERGQTICVHGTGSFVDTVIGTELAGKRKVCNSTLVMTARRHANVSHFAIETFVATTGQALNWVCEKLRWFKNARQISELAMTVNSAHGVMFLPALTGLRVPRMQANARASLSGISIVTTQAEVAYAVLEGIAHSVASCVEENEKISGVCVHEIVVGGGLSQSDALLQIQADLNGRPIRRMQETDRASLRGVAFLAGSCGLLWESLHAACQTVATEKVFMPGIHADAREQRRNRWHALVEAELKHAEIQSTCSTS